MKIIEISGREFRSNQKSYFDLSDKGAQIIVRRGANKAYIITSITIEDEYDRYFTKSMLAKIDESLKQAQNGKVTKAMNKEELHAFMNSL
jgi:hypothetical protein